MFLTHVVEEILALPAVLILWLLRLAREPVCALPPRQFTHDSATLNQVVMKGRPAHTSRGFLLQIGEVIGVKQTQSLFRTLKEVSFVPLERLHTGDVHIAQIKWLIAFIHPLRQSRASAASRLNTDRVKATGYPEVI